MKIIHVGLGTRGRRWLALVNERPAFRSVGCVDPDPAAQAWAASRFPTLGAAWHTRVDDALADVKADAAIIAGPVPLRAAQAVAALDSGLSVMTERPFAASLAEAARVLDASRRSGRPVMVAQPLRFESCERALRELVRNGRVGVVTHVSCVDRRRHRPEANFMQADHAQLLQAAPDHFDSVRNILGLNPVSVFARCTKAAWSPYRHGSTSEAIVEMEAGVYVQYHGSLTSGRDEHSLWIDGDRGTLWTDRAHVWWRKRGWPLFVPVLALNADAFDAARRIRRGMQALLDQLQAATFSNRTPETIGDDNIWTLSMIEAAIRSDKTSCVTSIGDLLAAAVAARSQSTR